MYKKLVSIFILFFLGLPGAYYPPESNPIRKKLSFNNNRKMIGVHTLSLGVHPPPLSYPRNSLF